MKQPRRINATACLAAMDRTGMSQSDIARLLLVSRTAVGKWIKGDSFPKPSYLIRLGMMLGLSHDQLVITETNALHQDKSMTTELAKEMLREAINSVGALPLDQQQLGVLASMLVRHDSMIVEGVKESCQESNRLYLESRKAKP